MTPRAELIEAMGTADCEWLMGHEGGGLPHMATLLDALLAHRDLLLEALGGVPWMHYVNYQPHETMWRFPVSEEAK